MCLSIAIKCPDHVLATGIHAELEWNVVHNNMGYRCGYVRISKGHPWHGMSYYDIPVRIHGGLTFSEYDVPCDKGGDDDAYWIGFDCAHPGDAQDRSLPRAHEHAMLAEDGGTVRSQEFVENECHSLAEQVDEAK